VPGRAAATTIQYPAHRRNPSPGPSGGLVGFLSGVRRPAVPVPCAPPPRTGPARRPADGWSAGSRRSSNRPARAGSRSRRRPASGESERSRNRAETCDRSRLQQPAAAGLVRLRPAHPAALRLVLLPGPGRDATEARYTRTLLRGIRWPAVERSRAVGRKQSGSDLRRYPCRLRSRPRDPRGMALGRCNARPGSRVTAPAARAAGAASPPSTRHADGQARPRPRTRLTC